MSIVREPEPKARPFGDPVEADVRFPARAVPRQSTEPPTISTRSPFSDPIVATASVSSPQSVSSAPGMVKVSSRISARLAGLGGIFKPKVKPPTEHPDENPPKVEEPAPVAPREA